MGKNRPGVIEPEVEPQPDNEEDREGNGTSFLRHQFCHGGDILRARADGERGVGMPFAKIVEPREVPTGALEERIESRFVRTRIAAEVVV